jgi:hypothetical protein
VGQPNRCFGVIKEETIRKMVISTKRVFFLSGKMFDIDVLWECTVFPYKQMQSQRRSHFQGKESKIGIARQLLRRKKSKRLKLILRD